MFRNTPNTFPKHPQMISKYFTSGKPITVYGELELNEWERGDTKYKDFQLNVRGWNFVNFGQPQQHEIELDFQACTMPGCEKKRIRKLVENLELKSKTNLQLISTKF